MYTFSNVNPGNQGSPIASPPHQVLFLTTQGLPYFRVLENKYEVNYEQF
jgi:hypothetical protein